MSDLNASTVKGLFFQLVKAVGGVEAAGAYLGVSHQRVSQLQSMNCADMPTVMQIATLECACGQSVVFRALAELAEPTSHASDPARETCDVVQATSDLLLAVTNGASERDVGAVVVRLHKEADDVMAAVTRRAAKT